VRDKPFDSVHQVAKQVIRTSHESHDTCTWNYSAPCRHLQQVFAISSYSIHNHKRHTWVTHAQLEGWSHAFWRLNSKVYWLQLLSNLISNAPLQSITLARQMKLRTGSSSFPLLKAYQLT